MKKIVIFLFILFSLLAFSPELSFAAETAAESATDESIVGMFGINWKLFIAQLINFGIVLFVLWKWVWKPVTNNMEARTKKIEDSLKNADEITREKEEFATWRTEEMSKARQEATEIINTAKQQAESVQAKILEKAKAEQQAILERNEQELNQQKTKMLQEAQNELASLVVSASEKLLRSKLDSKTDQKLINQALKDL